jgi:TolB-like protein/Tfp pilus assembly protein PilF
MSAPTQSSERLESWKEIAVFLRRDIRTVQRWEKTEGMPVHRHVHDKLGSIYAFKSELLEWQKQRSADPDAPEEGNPPIEGNGLEPEESAPVVTAPSAAENPNPAARLWRYALLAVLAVTAVASTWMLIRKVATGESSTARIVVLPFANLSGDSAQEYFSEGVTEELITSLARQSQTMRVTSFGSSLAYKGTQKTPEQIGKELKVDYVVTGSVRRSGDHVRITAHLMRTRDEAHLWDNSYDREITDILNVQSEVASAITEGISQGLPPRRGSPRLVNAMAYEAYLQGRFAWNKRTPEELHRAILYFQQSIAADPKYAPAYAGLADCYVLLGSAQMGALPPRVAMPQATQAVTQALELDPNLAEAHAALAHIKLIYDWDWAGAQSEFRRAIQLNPGYATAHQWYALYLNAAGKTSEAIQQLDTAAELDPLSPTIQSAVAEAYYFGRNYPLSEAAARRALQLDPEFALGYLVLGRTLEQEGKLEDALEAFQRGWELSGHAPTMTMFLAHAYAAKGDKAAAEKLLRQLQALTAKPNPPYIPPLYMASVYTGLGDLDRAFQYLDNAAEERCEYLIYLRREPMADPLRNDARLDAFLARNGLKP